MVVDCTINGVAFAPDTYQMPYLSEQYVNTYENDGDNMTSQRCSQAHFDDTLSI